MEAQSSKILLKSRGSNKKVPEATKHEFACYWVSIPRPPQEIGKMSLSTVYFPLVVNQDTYTTMLHAGQMLSVKCANLRCSPLYISSSPAWNKTSAKTHFLRSQLGYTLLFSFLERKRIKQANL